MAAIGAMEDWLAPLHRATRRARSRMEQSVARLRHGAPVLSVYDVRLKANWDDATFKFYVDGSYGRFYCDYLRGIAHAFIFIDIGANQGLYSLIAAQNPHCRRAIGFEPVKATFDLLTANIALNGLGAKIVALNVAVSSQDAVVPIRLKPGHSGAASLHHSFGAGETVETIRLAPPEILTPHLAPDLPLIVKIDTEGHEEVVVEALSRSAFAGRVMSVFYEVNTDWSNALRLEADLRAIGLPHFKQIGSGQHYDVLASRCDASSIKLLSND